MDFQPQENNNKQDGFADNPDETTIRESEPDLDYLIAVEHGRLKWEEKLITEAKSLPALSESAIRNGIPEQLCRRLSNLEPMARHEFWWMLMSRSDAGLTEAEFDVIAEWAERTLINMNALQALLRGELVISECGSRLAPSTGPTTLPIDPTSWDD